MGRGLISLMFAAGATTWIYTRFQRTTGNDSRRSVTAAALTGVLIFAVFFTFLSLVGVG